MFFHDNHAFVYAKFDLSLMKRKSLLAIRIQNLKKQNLVKDEKRWRPGRDSDPGPAGDSRIYWTRLYYLGYLYDGLSAATLHDALIN